ncbi:hypothetical protein QR685DRAFT_574642 [Neurospora intermedia]|uniref:Uncharacterized protein n=1 Tax=Neurospora intermedia TaxID=5142 RepID=A0ABR3D4E9_NEUIN
MFQAPGLPQLKDRWSLQYGTGMELEKASLSKVSTMRAEKEPFRSEQELLESPGDTYADSTAKVVRPQRCLPAGLKVSNRYSCSRTHRTLGHGKGRPGFMCPMTEDLQGRLQTSYTLTAHRAKDTNNCPEGVHANNNGQHNNITLHNFIPFD